MCVIVYQPPGKYLEKKLAQELWNANPDGAGFSFVDGDKIITAKTMEFPAFWSMFEEARSSHRQAPFLLHFRIATHGGVNLDNVHPFAVDEHTVLAHNGIIHGVPEYKDDDRSDTRVFVDEVLPFLKPSWLDDSTITHMVEEWIGWSRIIFLTTDPELSEPVYILNEKDGHWIGGLWFSNRSGQELPKPVKTHKIQHPKVWTTAPSVANLKVPKNCRTVETFDRWLEENVVPDGWPDPNEWLPSDDTEDDIGRLYSQMVNTRDASWLFQPFGYSLEFGWLCYGCDEPLSVPSGECQCWSKICLTCYLFTAECNCPAHLNRTTKHYDQLNTAQQEACARAEPLALEERKPLDESAIPTQAENHPH